jgi:RNA polymerase sigma-70 factor (ECF subfamily)
VVDDGSTPAPEIPAVPPKAVTSRRHDLTDVSHVEFATFYQAEMPRLVLSLIRCWPNKNDAEEAAQRAFALLFEQWDNVTYPRAWLRTVAFRSLLKLPVKSESSLGGREQPDALDPSAHVEHREEQHAVLSALHKLPLTQRQVFALHYDKFKTCEIAEILNMKEAAVRQNLVRARAALKGLLGLT